MAEREFDQGPIVEADALTRKLSEESVSQGCPLTRPILAPEELVDSQIHATEIPSQATNPQSGDPEPSTSQNKPF
jgi:hypothetical protein